MNKIIFIILLSSSLSWADGNYPKHESSLYQLRGNVESVEKAIGELIKEKNEASEVHKTHEIVEEIKSKLKERKETIIKFNKEYHHVHFEHPEKDGKFETRYKRYDQKHIQDYEDEINKLLSNVYQNVKKKYNEK